MTSLTVVKLAEPAGKPVAFANARPADGSLIMILTPTRRQARLGIWPGAAEETGILFDATGKVCGIARNHHALLTATFKPIVDQLTTGEPIKRGVLGVAIAEVPPDHPMRAQIPKLGNRPAARVEGFLQNSPAARAGVQLGDLIVQLNDDPVEDIATFAAAVANCRGTATLHILRNGQPIQIPVELAER
jgi:serine protease Do